MVAEGPALTLIFGGCRSGKSRWAETLADRSGRSVLYLATAAERPDDPAWIERLQRHRQRRPAHWLCRETGPDLVGTLIELQRSAPTASEPLLLIDSLGTWLAQHLDLEEPSWREHCDALLQALADHRAPVLMVCEEVGLGVVPATAIGGRFRDRMGELQQQLMDQAGASWLVVAGRALDLHALGHRVPGG
ncbi:MAG: hypothetical protein RLZZ124_666 [Cyanobacteriota bacterium]